MTVAFKTVSSGHIFMQVAIVCCQLFLHLVIFTLDYALPAVLVPVLLEIKKKTGRICMCIYNEPVLFYHHYFEECLGSVS